MQKIIFLKGLPASGKSTWAKQQCIENLFIERINKDDIRESLGNPKWSNEFENLVLLLEKIEGIKVLMRGNSLIIDDTNFSSKHRTYWMKISNFTSEIEFESELKNLEECVELNKYLKKN